MFVLFSIRKSPIFNHKLPQSSDFQPETTKPDTLLPPTIKTVQIKHPPAETTWFWSTSPIQRGFSPFIFSSLSLTDWWAIHLSSLCSRPPRPHIFSLSCDACEHFPFLVRHHPLLPHPPRHFSSLACPLLLALASPAPRAGSSDRSTTSTASLAL